MHNILVITKNTFKECIRDRILYSILAFAFLFLASTIFLGSLSLGEDLKVIKDFGLTGIYLFAIIIAIFIGTSLVYKEIEKKTLLVTLSRPVSKNQFILGKFIGLLGSIVLVLLSMAVLYLIIVAARGGGFDTKGLVAVLMTIPEIAIFIGLSILFSTFSTPLASTIYAVLVLIIGHSFGEAVSYFSRNGGIGFYIFKAIYFILPNLEKFNLRNLVVHDISISGQQILLSLGYGIIYTALLLIISSWSLEKQEL